MAKNSSVESAIAARTTKAAKALKKYLDGSATSEKTALIEEAPEAVYLSVTGKKFFSNKRELKPRVVKLEHSVYSEVPKTLLFVKDPQRDYKNVLQADDSERIVDRIVGVTKLKGKFKPYEARRALKAEYDLILADENIIPMLPKLLGKSFYGQASSVPIAVRIRQKGEIDAKKTSREVEKIKKSTVLLVPGSTKFSVRIGNTSMTPKQISENVVKVLDFLKSKEISSIDNLRTVTLKTKESPALPVYQAEELFTEKDIGVEEDEKLESEKSKRKRENAHLDSLLAEVVDDEDIKEYNREQKRRRKPKASGSTTEANADGDRKGKPNDGSIDVGETEAASLSDAGEVGAEATNAESESDVKSTSEPEEEEDQSDSEAAAATDSESESLDESD